MQGVGNEPHGFSCLHELTDHSLIGHTVPARTGAFVPFRRSGGRCVDEAGTLPCKVGVWDQKNERRLRRAAVGNPIGLNRTRVYD